MAEAAATDQDSPLYLDFHKINLSYFRDLINEDKISVSVARKLLDYWELRITEPRDPLYSSYFEYYLFFESINAGILSAFVYDLERRQVKHQYGVLSATTVEILQGIEAQDPDEFFRRAQDGMRNEFEYQGEKLSLHLKSIVFGKRKYVIGILYPFHLNIDDKLERIENVFLRFYLPDIFQPDLRFLPLFHELDERILPDIQKTLAAGQPVTFTYFRFQNFQKFVKLAGEHFAAEIVNGLVAELTSKLKTEDSCYVLNPREYLIVSLDCEKEVLEKRYARMMFQVKSLLLNYKVKYTTITDPVKDMADIWPQISLEE